MHCLAIVTESRAVVARRLQVPRSSWLSVDSLRSTAIQISIRTALRTAIRVEDESVIMACKEASGR